ncbi:MAG: hypothetical protein C0478_13805 [Planctomyces sp.]|nr:hypothetical protein [Planctomyces sp.]
MVSEELAARLTGAETPAAVFDRLIEQLSADKSWHLLFDALLAKAKLELGLPVLRPTSFEDVPAKDRAAFEKSYAVAARQVGEGLLAQKDVAGAFPYFQAIRDLEPVARAIKASPIPQTWSEESQALVQIALYQKAAPDRGVEMMLKMQGTCSTITALDQVFAELTSADRSRCAILMVRTLHKDLLANLAREVQQRLPLGMPPKTIREAITGRDWLFADANYHIDVSHLHSVVRFARSIMHSPADLALARDLAEYGAMLDPQLQYSAEPPFDDYYTAHQRYFGVLVEATPETDLAWFQKKLDAEPDAPDRALIAYVMVDLLARLKRTQEAIPLAKAHLLGVDPQFLSAFAELCRDAGDWDTLAEVAKEQDDPVLLAAALSATRG